MDIFQYGEREMNYLTKKDKKLGAAIQAIGLIEREVNPDVFSALVRAIVGQQISTKAQITIWERMKRDLLTVTPEAILSRTESELQSYGISFRKVSYIRGVAERVADGRLDIARLSQKNDEDICKELVQLNGVGVWTAEMIMLFSMQRPNILSYGDLAILRGLRVLYHHKEITKPLFEKYQKRYSPYGSVASLYLWEIAGMDDASTIKL